MGKERGRRGDEKRREQKIRGKEEDWDGRGEERKIGGKGRI